VPSAVLIGTRTECRFILIACPPMALVLPIDSAAGGATYIRTFEIIAGRNFVLPESLEPTPLERIRANLAFYWTR